MQRAQVRSLVPHAATKTWCSQINKEIKSSVWHIVGIRYLEKLLLNVEWKSLMQFTTALWSLERVRPGLRLWLWQCLGGLLPMSESGFHYLKQGSTRMLITHRKLDVAVLGESAAFGSVQFSRSVVSDSLRPHELQHAIPHE